MALVQINLQFRDSLGAGLGSTLVTVQNEGQTVNVASDTSDGSGNVSFSVTESTTYKLLLSRLLTVYTVPVTLTVGAGPTPLTYTIVGTTQTVLVPPTDPAVCRIYGYVTHPNNVPFSGATITFDNLYTLKSVAGKLVTPRMDAVTDTTGFFYADLFRTLPVKVMIQDMRIAARFVVPDAATADLTTLLAAAEDEIGAAVLG